MSKVQIPPVLRQSTGGARVVEASGDTLGELLDNLYAQYPDLQSRISSDNGLSTYVNVYVNDEDVRTLGGIKTPVAASDTVIILPAMAGG